MRHDGKSTGLFSDEEPQDLEETKYKLKMDDPSPSAPEPAPAGDAPDIDAMGSLDDIGGGLDGGLDEPANDKPFDDEPFEAGVEADETEQPEEYIQQLSGKLGQSLRQYTDNMGQPDFDLEKFAINSVISATHTSEMDDEDRKDIIDKINSSGQNDGADDGANDGADVEVDKDVNIDMEEPNGEEEDLNFDDMNELDSNFTNDPKWENDDNWSDDDNWNEAVQLGNDIELSKGKKSSIFEGEIKSKLQEMSEPVVKPTVAPKTTPMVKPGRKTRTWSPKPANVPTKMQETEPSENEGRILNILKTTENYIKISTLIKGKPIVMEFERGDLVEKPRDYDEPWVYDFLSIDSPDGLEYKLVAEFSGHPKHSLEFSDFGGETNQNNSIIPTGKLNTDG